MPSAEESISGCETAKCLICAPAASSLNAFVHGRFLSMYFWFVVPLVPCVPLVVVCTSVLYYMLFTFNSGRFFRITIVTH